MQNEGYYKNFYDDEEPEWLRAARERYNLGMKWGRVGGGMQGPWGPFPVNGFGGYAQGPGRVQTGVPTLPTGYPTTSGFKQQYPGYTPVSNNTYGGRYPATNDLNTTLQQNNMGGNRIFGRRGG